MDHFLPDIAHFATGLQMSDRLNSKILCKLNSKYSNIYTPLKIKGVPTQIIEGEITCKISLCGHTDFIYEILKGNVA